jgi:hypothetical protein
MAIDFCVLAAAPLVIDAQRAAWSIVAAVAISSVLLWNHRPGRYRAAA